MSDDLPFYAPNKPPRPAREPNRGEHLWSLLNDNVRYDVELRDDYARGAGTELQLFRDDEFIYGRRYVTRDAAIAEADALKAILQQQGWIG
jgi:hypothetical protein